MRLLHLSDFHLSKHISLTFIEKAIRLGVRCKPDLICLTGDFITHKAPDWPAYTRILKTLTDVAPAYACYGNHDGGAWSITRGGYATRSEVGGMLDGAGIVPLRNKAAPVTVNGQPLEIVGLGDLWANDIKPADAFPPGTYAGARIVLAHNPDSKDLLAPHAWDLMLCGHTHGGQLKLPLIGTPFAPVRDPLFVAGLNPWRGRLIYTTRGVGNLHGIRFNCPPEVSILELSGG